jgi:hypothetical protein
VGLSNQVKVVCEKKRTTQRYEDLYYAIRLSIVSKRCEYYTSEHVSLPLHISNEHQLGGFCYSIQVYLRLTKKHTMVSKSFQGATLTSKVSMPLRLCFGNHYASIVRELH